MSREKYIGTKFQTIFLGKFLPTTKQKALIKNLIAAGKTFGKMGIKDKNGGNISVRVKDGLIIKRTGAHPYELKMKDFVLVTKASGNKVYAYGSAEPSSEARLHLGIYKARKDINAILHCHDFLAVYYPLKFKDIGYIKEQPYGTLKLAKDVATKAKKFDYLIEENHGIIAYGKNISTALNLIKKYHQRVIPA